MKNKYYYINEEGEKILVRTSNNEYKYALVIKGYKDNKGTLKCSINKTPIEKEFEYRTKGYGHNMEEKVNGKYLYSSQFMNPNTLQIVELIKE